MPRVTAAAPCGSWPHEQRQSPVHSLKCEQRLFTPQAARAEAIAAASAVATVERWREDANGLLPSSPSVFIDVRDAGGLTPLHWAARAGRADVVAWLLTSGADARAVGERGETPLDFAHPSDARTRGALRRTS